MFDSEHYLIFNSKKSLAIKCGNKMTGTEYVLLGQIKINWVDIVKHFTLTHQLIVMTV